MIGELTCCFAKKHLIENLYRPTSVSVESEDFQRFLVGSFDLEGAIVSSAGIAHFLNF